MSPADELRLLDFDVRDRWTLVAIYDVGARFTAHAEVNGEGLVHDLVTEPPGAGDQALRDAIEHHVQGYIRERRAARKLDEFDRLREPRRPRSRA